MKPVRVPLAVDAQVRVPFGPALLPLRTVVLLAAVSPLALLALEAGALPVNYRVGLTLTVFLVASTFAAPMREGIWIGTWAFYRCLRWFVPTAVVDGAPRRARVREVGDAIEVTQVRKPISSRAVRRLQRAFTIPGIATVESGVIQLSPGGGRAVLLVHPPDGSIHGDAYAAWCARLVTWLLAVECPAQFIAVVSHHDSHRAQRAFDDGTHRWPRTRLLEFERALAGSVAAQSLCFRHFVVFAPGLSQHDGLPRAHARFGLARAPEASTADAKRTLHLAMRLAASSGVNVSPPDRDDVAALFEHSLMGATSLAVGRDGVVHLGDQHLLALTAVRLPPIVHSGMIVDTVMRARCPSAISLHVFPVDTAVARRALDRKLSLRRYTAREGNDGIDNQIAAADTAETLAAIARREITPCRVAITMVVSDARRDRLAHHAERVRGLLHGQGFEATIAGSPGWLPALAVAPGLAPLARSMQLTSDGVAACLVPALGTPFSDPRQTLVGSSELTGAPVYCSVWSRPNHNAVIVGSSGSGKSATTKTLLMRHVMQQASAVVIDPDSEYRRLIQAIGGTHIELGDDALNPLGAGGGAPADTAASLVLPVLSVMAGDEKGVRDGRPIRRLRDEDQGWLHAELATFFRTWRSHRARAEPRLSDLVDFIETESAPGALTPREQDRARLIVARLRRFTQGERARVFDRASTFDVGASPVAIGFRQLSLAYAADLTPALAVVLTGVLAALKRRTGRLIVVVDEAHRVTSDPDAGDVLGQLVRQARKYESGVWMCSQRVEDFVGTELGRTLAATAATKIVLGVEEAALSGLTEAFALTEEEAAAVNPPVQGRAVLVSGTERTIVRVMPGPAVLALVDGGIAPEPVTAGRAG